MLCCVVVVVVYMCVYTFVCMFVGQEAETASILYNKEIPVYREKILE